MKIKLPWQLSRILRNLLVQYPQVYYSIFRLRGGNPKNATQSNTDIVIEGPPRTANTFMVEAFNHIQKKKYKIAHHFHTPVQIIQGLKFKKPIIVLIRHPKDTCISHALADGGTFDQLKRTLYWYIDFFTPLMPHKGKIVFGDFEDIISNPGKIIDATNDMYGTSFESYNSTLQFKEQEVIERINKLYLETKSDWFGETGSINEMRVSRPSEKRKKMKKEMLHTLEDAQIKPLYNQALQLYHFFSNQ